MCERARALLARLDPVSGNTRTAFFTTDRSLLGLGFPLQEAGSSPVPRTECADGTAKRGAVGAGTAAGALTSGPDAPARHATGNGPGSLPVSDDAVLLSVLVPRTAAGLAATKLLKTQMAATAAREGQEPAAIGQTTQLANGTTVTATGFDTRQTAPEDPESEVGVQVRFCVGDDAAARDLPPETRRSIPPTDVSMVNDRLGEAWLLDSVSQLRRDPLAQDRCAVRELVFRSSRHAVPRLAYANAAGDEVLW